MATRARAAVAAVVISVGALVLVGLAVPGAQARPAAVPRVTGLAAAGANLTTARLALTWKKVKGATYQVRFASSTGALGKAPRTAARATAAWSPVLTDVCLTWYGQVRAKKKGKFGAWSAAKSLKFPTSGVTPATPITTGQTSTTQVQVRWARKPGAAGYRLHYSPGPYGNWPGYFPYTPTTGPTATGTAVTLPPVGPGDRMMGAAYGNPLFVQLETKRCSGSYAKVPFTAVWPKGLPAGDASTGSRLRVGTYNLANAAAGAQKLANIADNIAAAQLDVIALQEAAGAKDSLERLLAAEGQGDWESFGAGAQQVMWRTGAWRLVSGHDVGQPNDGTAATPLPTPAVRLTPTISDSTRQDILVMSVHLEDRAKFFPKDAPPPVADRKQDAHDAARVLLANLAVANPDQVPVVAAGDFKGNFGGGQAPGAGYCDESSSPPCVGEGQPTFIREGKFIDAQAAVSKVGVAYGTVNKNQVQTPNPIGFGGRADYLLFRGFPGVASYVNVVRSYGTAGPAEQPDHNLLHAEAYVPFLTP